jgi:hypothetical protein
MPTVRPIFLPDGLDQSTGTSIEAHLISLDSFLSAQAAHASEDGPEPGEPDAAAGTADSRTVAAGDGTAMTVTLFEDEEAGRRSEAAAARVRESLAEFRVEEIDALAGEVMVSRASEKALRTVHH